MLREILYFEDTIFRIDSLLVFSNLKNSEPLVLLKDISRLILDGFETNKRQIVDKYYRFIGILADEAEKNGFSNNTFSKYIIDSFLSDVNDFSIACENNKNIKNTTIYTLALKDIANLKYFIDFDIKNLCENIGFNENVYNYIPINPNEFHLIEQIEATEKLDTILELFVWCYENMGISDLNKHSMYKLDFNVNTTASGKYTLPIVEIENVDKVVFNDIIGCKIQKSMLISNTEAFLADNPANNILLAGARGTGKSSCVKALVNEYYAKGLRLIKVEVDEIYLLKELLKKLGKRSKKIIVFIDDLSFSHVDVNYLCFKSLLEGGAEVCPSNVLFYVTSNRRHIVKEQWEDKQDGAVQEELHTSDGINEKLSLSDRFGITITFPKPSPEEYIDIVYGIAKQEKLSISEDFLKEQAMKWEVEQKNLSGRRARQFVNNIICEMRRI